MYTSRYTLAPITISVHLFEPVRANMISLKHITLKNRLKWIANISKIWSVIVIRYLLLEDFLDLEGLCKNKANIFPSKGHLVHYLLSKLTPFKTFNAVINKDFIFDFKSRTLLANSPRNERRFFAQKIEPATLTIPTILRFAPLALLISMVLTT